jgi:hypothetical protein
MFALYPKEVERHATDVGAVRRAGTSLPHVAAIITIFTSRNLKSTTISKADDNIHVPNQEASVLRADARQRQTQ